MVFASLQYIYIFLPAVFASWWLLGFLPHFIRHWWLLFASLFFYAYGSTTIVLLFLCSITINNVFGWLIKPESRYGAWIAGLGVLLNILLLGYYKYAGFFLGNINTLFGSSYPALSFVLPLGISFFTFQQIAYLVDRYKGKVDASPWGEYALFVAFFPQLIAGPIVHHREMVPQFKKIREKVQPATMMVGLSLLSFGLFKKTILADNFAGWADPVFAMPQNVHMVDAWIGTLSFAFQIYFDFSAYSDMAIGSALLFGIRLPVNFLSPYSSSSITEFWQRWHITLSKWLREYLYFPLGGSRKGILRTVINATIVMVIAGLWHGAAWGFILWGLLHGVGLAIHKIWASMGGRLGVIPARMLTFLFVLITWVPFRSTNFEDMFALWKRLFHVGDITDRVSTLPVWYAGIFAISLLVPNTMQLTRYSQDGKLQPVSIPLAMCAAIALFTATLPLLLREETPFIYFGF